jgi:hypothetical protein
VIAQTNGDPTATSDVVQRRKPRPVLGSFVAASLLAFFVATVPAALHVLVLLAVWSWNLVN